MLILTEFGAEANPLNAPRGPGSEASRRSLLTATSAVTRRPADRREMIWVLHDFALTPSSRAARSAARSRHHLVRGINQKGLFNYRGQPKPAVAAVRAGVRGLMEFWLSRGVGGAALRLSITREADPGRPRPRAVAFLCGRATRDSVLPHFCVADRKPRTSVHAVLR